MGPRFRMIHVDHYMSRPLSPFDDARSEWSGKPVSKVPVIRIFGADQEGRKICLHVHGYYPYVAIQNSEPEDPELASKIVKEVERALDVISTEHRQRRADQPRDPQQRPQQEPGERARGDQDADRSPVADNEDTLRARLVKERRPLPDHLPGDMRSPIHRVEKVEAYNYYGYHHKPEPFFKLHLYNPKMVKQLALVFEDCRVQARFVPVFWAHLPYILLFFIDNNLRGMQFIEVDHLYWRQGKAPRLTQSPDGVSPDEAEALASRQDEIDQFTTEADPMSSCELEADIRFEWILNKRLFDSKGNDTALRELWLDDQESSQTSSLPDDPHPLYNVERSYFEQLCDAYEVVPNTLKLELTKKPKEELKVEPEEDCFDSDDSDLFIEALQRYESTQRAAGNVKRESLSPDEAATTSTRADSKPPKLPSPVALADVSLHLPRSRRASESTQSSSQSIKHEFQYICTMSMEVHVSTRAKLRPDPVFDPIEAIFYCVRNDVPEGSKKPAQVIGLIITDPFKCFSRQSGTTETAQSPVPGQSGAGAGVTSPAAKSAVSFVQQLRTLLNRTGLSIKDLELKVVETELELIMSLVEMVKKHDPEILVGYEMEQLSWGYILERAGVFNVDIGASLSRVANSNLSQNSKLVESNFVQPIMFTGRMVFSTWRIIRHEINLATCSYERIHEHALNERVPCFAFETLTKWFNSNKNRWRVIDYYVIRVIGQMRILEKFDLIAKVSELARCYGTQFIDVITRGSQIGIESMMLRLARLQQLFPLSPTVMQRNKMRAPEALPLVMEPETNIYYDPVAVLDFQSLYPSVVIAYNYCYSTCLGRVVDLESKRRYQFGCSHLELAEEEVRRLLESDSVHVSPCGVAFVKKRVRHGVLPKMLSELIVTRAMVKDQMKKNMRQERPNRRLQRILDHRQHGLKMMANTTYGYTGASYTGRMPCVEIADSIVSKGRETLENAIELVESRAEWGAKVIYGDTDSIFIQFRGCDRDTAFKRAYEMVEAITSQNPRPIKMKFEKIYQPCVLQTKKRYCGFKFESPDQVRPEFEAKGMETIRRDSCPAAARMLEMALRIQFTTRDVNEVRRYVEHQFLKIMSGKVSNLKQFIFARRYKPRALDKSESVFVPAWQITKRLLALDPRSEPRLNESVPFVIIYGEPRTPLVHLAKTPMELLDNLAGFRINADYYIQKIICPTLNRVFCTLRVDTLAWYKAMPRQNIVHRSHYLVAQHQQRARALGAQGPLAHSSSNNTAQATMSQFFSPSHCPVCAKSIPISEDICADCGQASELQSSVMRLSEEITRNQRKLFAYHQICRACSSLERTPHDAAERSNRAANDDDAEPHQNPCISYDCDNLFHYHQAKLDAMNSDYLSQVLRALY